MNKATQHLIILIHVTLYRWVLKCEEGKRETKQEREKQITIVKETLYDSSTKQDNTLSMELDRFYTELIAIYGQHFSKLSSFSANRRIAFQFAFKSFIAQFSGYPENTVSPHTNLESCLVFMNTYSIPVECLSWAIEYWRAVIHKLKSLEISEDQAEGSLGRLTLSSQ